MSEISAQFGNQLNGYNKTEVNLFLKNIETELQKRAATIDSLQQQINAMQEQLEKAAMPEAAEAAEKIELYDKLMKKMDGDYNNLLAPAVAKAKAIQAQAERDYEIRMDQARATADGIYDQAAGRIAAVVDQNMDRLYALLDEFIYSKTLPGRVENFIKACGIVSRKVASGVSTAAKIPGKACSAVSSKVQSKVGHVKKVIHTYKQNKSGTAQDAAQSAE